MATEIVYLAAEQKSERKAVVVDRELEKIYKRHKTITVDVLLDEASKPKHPLNSYFEWDDAAAGLKYRKVQAYSLIMGSKFVVQLVQNGQAPTLIRDKARVRRLVSAFRGEGFKMRTDVLADADMRKAVIATKKSALRSWCDSTIDIPELEPLREAIRSFL